MRKVFIIYSKFLTRDGSSVTIGGIQTYIKMLSEVVTELNMVPIIYQYADKPFEINYNNITVKGIYVKDSWSQSRKKKELFNSCKKQYNSEKDIIIFATDSMVVKNNLKRVIGIQHGISWDILETKKQSNLKNMLFIYKRATHALKIINRMKYLSILVAVDYNFLNWYRTQVSNPNVDIKVIPNCTTVSNFEKRKSNNINIIFARRFFEYRGTKLFAKAIQKVLMNFDNVYVTFAGSGPDEKYLKQTFEGNSKVNFITYNSEDSLKLHKNYQIAVVPTIGSEGTSLSLLEAMSAKCAVIATNVGGMSNIILDNFNGLLINPTENELYNAIEKLVLNEKLRNKLSENAFMTVSQAFSKELWKRKWIEVLSEIKNT